MYEIAKAAVTFADAADFDISPVPGGAVGDKVRTDINAYTGPTGIKGAEHSEHQLGPDTTPGTTPTLAPTDGPRGDHYELVRGYPRVSP